jgi:hypothetical protein
LVALAKCNKANKFLKSESDKLTPIFIPEGAQAEKKQLSSIHSTPTTMTHDVLRASPPKPIKIPTREVSGASPQPEVTIQTIFGFTRHWETQQPPSKPSTPTYVDNVVSDKAGLHSTPTYDDNFVNDEVGLELIVECSEILNRKPSFNIASELIVISKSFRAGVSELIVTYANNSKDEFKLIVDSEGVQDSASIIFVDATASSSLEVFDGASTFLKDSFDAASKLIVSNSKISHNFC